MTGSLRDESDEFRQKGMGMGRGKGEGFENETPNERLPSLCCEGGEDWPPPKSVGSGRAAWGTRALRGYLP